MCGRGRDLFRDQCTDPSPRTGSDCHHITTEICGEHIAGYCTLHGTYSTERCVLYSRQQFRGAGTLPMSSRWRTAKQAYAWVKCTSDAVADHTRASLMLVNFEASTCARTFHAPVETHPQEDLGCKSWRERKVKNVSWSPVRVTMLHLLILSGPRRIFSKADEWQLVMFKCRSVSLTLECYQLHKHWILPYPWKVFVLTIIF